MSDGLCITEITDQHSLIRILGVGFLTEIMERDLPLNEEDKRDRLINLFMNQMSESSNRFQFIKPLVVEWHEDELNGSLSFVVFEHPYGAAIEMVPSEIPLYMLGSRTLVIHTTISQETEFILQVDYHYGYENDLPQEVIGLFPARELIFMDKNKNSGKHYTD